MRGAIDVVRFVALARHGLTPAPFLFLLARKRQPDTGDHVLAHPLRRAILDAVKQSRGLTMGELRKVVPLGWGNGYHHLNKLERAGHIRKQRVGRRLIISAGVVVPDEESKARAYLKSTVAAAICADIHAHPGTDVGDVVARTGLSQRSVYYNIQTLTVLGILISRSRTRQFALHTTPLYASVSNEG